MLKFRTKQGYEGYIKKEGLLWWKKWRVYLNVRDHFTMLDELNGSMSFQEVVDYLKLKYPEITF